MDPLPDPLPIAPLAQPPDAVVAVPGGRSVTNRALVAAALAEGTSELVGAGLSDDSEAMVDCLRALGASIDVVTGEGGPTVRVAGVGGGPCPCPGGGGRGASGHAACGSNDAP